MSVGQGQGFGQLLAFIASCVQRLRDSVRILGFQTNSSGACMLLSLGTCRCNTSSMDMQCAVRRYKQASQSIMAAPRPQALVQRRLYSLLFMIVVV